MRAAAATVVLAGAGLLAGHALADSVPVPGTSTTVSAPSLPVRVPTVPRLPVPAKPAPRKPAPTKPVPTLPAVPKTPAVPTVTKVPTKPAPTPAPVTGPLPSVPDSSGPVASLRSVPAATGSATGSFLGGNGGSSEGNRSGSSSGTAGATSSGSRSESASVESFRTSRSWIAKSGPRSRRATVLTFALSRPARVFFVVKQVSPVCRIVGRFSVLAHAGRNQVRIPGPAGFVRRLDPGTYRISARTGTGSLVRRVTIVVVGTGAPSPAELAAARAANVCSPSSRLASVMTGASNIGVSDGQPSSAPAQPSASGPVRGANTHTGAVLGSSVERAARAVQPLLLALLAFAILFLGVASLPQMGVPGSRAGYLLARHRVEIAGLGATALVAVVIAFLVG